MSEETTERMNNGDTFETRVLTALAAINGQLGSMNARLTAVEARLTALERKVDALDVRLTSVETRLTVVEQKVDTLEEKVDARLRETRPIWEAVMHRLDEMNAKFAVFAREMLEVKADIVMLQKGVPPAA